MAENKNFTIIGAGHQGMAMAAHLSLCGNEVYLWNRSSNHIEEIKIKNEIVSEGVLKGIAKIKKVSTNIDEVLTNTILVTTPASSHKDIAKLLAKRITKNSVILLNPGRTFGAFEFLNTLRENGCKCTPQIAETQTIIYTCRRSEINSVYIFAFKRNVKIASVNCKDINKILLRLPNCMQQYFLPAQSCFDTSLGNVGMVLHCAPVLMNIGWIESSIVEFKYYYDGISKSIAKFLEKIDKERVYIAKKVGINVPTLVEWLKETYLVNGDDIYTCLQNNIAYKNIDAPNTIKHRYIEEDIPCGLVPIESLGEALNIKTPCISLIIDLANEIMDTDFRKNGRKFYKEYFDYMK